MGQGRRTGGSGAGEEGWGTETGNGGGRESGGVGGEALNGVLIGFGHGGLELLEEKGVELVDAVGGAG